MKISMEKTSSSKPQKTTFLDFAFSSAKILFLVVGIASTLFLISTRIQRFILSFSSPITWNYPDFSRLSSAYLFVIVHFIIFIIWKLNANHLQDSTHDSSDFYSSPSISRKSSIEDVLVSQPSSESIKEFRTTSQEIPVPEPVVDIHTVESVNGKNRTTSREIPDPVLDIHTVESVDVKSPPSPIHDEYSDDMRIDEEDDYSDSLDATWQAIIQKQLEKGVGDSWEKFNQQVQAKLRLTRDVPVPVIQSKEFRKSETFKENEAEDHTGKKEMRKSKTFRENNGSIGWRGRNVWVEKDETFRSKVEAFIKMNYDQRLKKQGSNDNCRVEMVNTAY